MIAADPIVLVPGSPEWQQEMTASKVSAVLGLSPWESRFSLWYTMAGAVPPQAETPQMTRGHYLEDAVATWLADRYGLALAPGYCWRNRARPWQVASPDRLAVDPQRRTPDYVAETALAVVEAKTDAGGRFVWGPDGSDDIPGHYRAQVVWQCDTLGLPRGYVGVLLDRLEFRGYEIVPEPGEAEFIREECRAFLDSLAAGDPPDPDAHGATYETLRALHPDIQGEVDVTWEDAHLFAKAAVGLEAAKGEWDLQRNRMGALMGSAKAAVCGDVTVAVRSPAPSTGRPYVGATRSKRNLAALAADPTTEEDTSA